MNRGSHTFFRFINDPEPRAQREARERAAEEARETRRREALAAIAESPTVEVPKVVLDALWNTAGMPEHHLSPETAEVLAAYEEMMP